MVQLLAAYGVPDGQIAKSLDMTKLMLRKVYDRELVEGNLRANSMVAECLYRQAVNGNVHAAIWWTKARLGWTDTAHGGGGEGADERWPRIIIEVRDPTRPDPPAPKVIDIRPAGRPIALESTEPIN